MIKILIQTLPPHCRFFFYESLLKRLFFVVICMDDDVITFEYKTVDTKGGRIRNN